MFEAEEHESKHEATIRSIKKTNEYTVKKIDGFENGRRGKERRGRGDGAKTEELKVENTIPNKITK